MQAGLTAGATVEVDGMEAWLTTGATAGVDGTEAGLTTMATAEVVGKQAGLTVGATAGVDGMEAGLTIGPSSYSSGSEDAGEMELYLTVSASMGAGDNSDGAPKAAEIETSLGGAWTGSEDVPVVSQYSNSTSPTGLGLFWIT